MDTDRRPLLGIELDDPEIDDLLRELGVGPCPYVDCGGIADKDQLGFPHVRNRTQSTATSFRLGPWITCLSCRTRSPSRSLRRITGEKRAESPPHRPEGITTVTLLYGFI